MNAATPRLTLATKARPWSATPHTLDHVGLWREHANHSALASDRAALEAELDTLADRFQMVLGSAVGFHSTQTLPILSPHAGDVLLLITQHALAGNGAESSMTDEEAWRQLLRQVIDKNFARSVRLCTSANVPESIRAVLLGKELGCRLDLRALADAFTAATSPTVALLVVSSKAHIALGNFIGRSHRFWAEAFGRTLPQPGLELLR